MRYEQLGYYVDVWMLIKETQKRCRPKTKLLSQDDDPGLLELLWDLAKMFRIDNDASSPAALNPFPGFRDLHSEVLEHCRNLEEAVEVSPDEESVRLKSSLYNSLRDLLQRAEYEFRKEVHGRTIFIASEYPGPAYLSFEKFLRDETDRRLIEYLPRLSQSSFRDAGKCLVYGLPGAAISLSLQAVETAIRYFYMRHGGESDKLNWQPMVERLWSAGLLPGGRNDGRLRFEEFQSLAKNYRNSIAHGRAVFEDGRSEASLSEAEQIFLGCWRAARALASETQAKRQLRIQIKISSQPTIDQLISTYLYYWNPELPPVDEEMFEFDSQIDGQTILDSTLVDWPGTIVPSSSISASAGRSISRILLGRFCLQPNYSAILEPLVTFADECSRGEYGAPPAKEKFEKNDPSDLWEVLWLIIYFHGSEHRQLLRTTWSLLEKYVGGAFLDGQTNIVDGLELRYTLENFRDKSKVY